MWRSCNRHVSVYRYSQESISLDRTCTDTLCLFGASTLRRSCTGEDRQVGHVTYVTNQQFQLFNHLNAHKWFRWNESVWNGYWDDSSLHLKVQCGWDHCVIFPLSLGSVVTALWRFSYTVGPHHRLWMEDYIRLKIWLICSQTASTLATSNGGKKTHQSFCDCCCYDIRNALFYMGSVMVSARLR